MADNIARVPPVLSSRSSPVTAAGRSRPQRFTRGGNESDWSRRKLGDIMRRTTFSRSLEILRGREWFMYSPDLRIPIERFTIYSPAPLGRELHIVEICPAKDRTIGIIKVSTGEILQWIRSMSPRPKETKGMMLTYDCTAYFTQYRGLPKNFNQKGERILVEIDRRLVLPQWHGETKGAIDDGSQERRQLEMSSSVDDLARRLSTVGMLDSVIKGN